jgi:hypothetical protein
MNDKNEKLFNKAWDKFRAHEETAPEKVCRIAHEHFGIRMMSIQALDILKEWYADRLDESFDKVCGYVLNMSEAGVADMIQDFICHHAGENPCPESF